MSYAEEYDRLRYLRRLGIITDLEAEELLRPLQPISFDYAELEEKIMHNFMPGDKVRLKDSPYTGKVEQLLQGWDYVRFVTDNYTQITVSDPTLLVHAIDPQAGDIYEDKNGHEWVILKQRGWSAQPKDFLAARCIDHFDYVHSTLSLNKPENVVTWSENYGVRLVRRRGA